MVSREFVHALNLLIADVFPRIVASKGHLARAELGTAFQQGSQPFKPSVQRPRLV